MQRMQLGNNHFSPPHRVPVKLDCEPSVSGGLAWHKHRKRRTPAQLSWLAPLNTTFQSEFKSPARIFFSSLKGLFRAPRQSVTLPTCPKDLQAYPEGILVETACLQALAES